MIRSGVRSVAAISSGLWPRPITRRNRRACANTCSRAERSAEARQAPAPINRPYDDEENGESVLVYVLKPTVTIDKDVGARTLIKPR